ncbi:MAG: hypothetical protein HY814_11080 [Candidatus Riflebacteria bacterium]|nr:hypothetical protein [Candidatus Riflebacteria bacterium]
MGTLIGLGILVWLLGCLFGGGGNGPSRGNGSSAGQGRDGEPRAPRFNQYGEWE